MIDNNADAADGTHYTVSEIIAAVTAADATRIDSGTGFPTYRFLKNLVVGGASSNATLLQDVNCTLTFDATRILRTRTTNTTNVGITFGTRVGSGNSGSGGNGVTVLLAPTTSTAMAIRGTVKLYGSRFSKSYLATSQALQFPAVNSGSELVNCQFDGFTSYVLGSSGFNIGLIYNLDITRPNAATNIITAFFVDVAERITVSSLRTADANLALSSNTANVSFRDAVFFGDFTGGGAPGVLSAGGTATGWKLVHPQWPTGVNLFGVNSVALADDGAHEYWEYDPQVVDGTTGTPLSGIPVKLTDILGNVQVDEITGSNGRITFGSGITANMVIVADHYTGGRRTRSDFLAEVNTGASANPAYPEVTYRFDWPGDDTGRYGEVWDIIPLGNPAGGAGTVWVEQTL